MLVIGLRVDDVVAGVLADVLIIMLAAVTVGASIGVLVDTEVVVVTSALLAFESAVPLSYVVKVMTNEWTEEAIDTIDVSIGRRVAECIAGYAGVISGVASGICGDIVADMNLKVVAAVETLSDFTTPAPFED